MGVAVGISVPVGVGRGVDVLVDVPVEVEIVGTGNGVTVGAGRQLASKINESTNKGRCLIFISKTVILQLEFQIILLLYTLRQ